MFKWLHLKQLYAAAATAAAVGGSGRHMRKPSLRVDVGGPKDLHRGAVTPKGTDKVGVLSPAEEQKPKKQNVAETTTKDQH